MMMSQILHRKEWLHSKHMHSKMRNLSSLHENEYDIDVAPYVLRVRSMK